MNPKKHLKFSLHMRITIITWLVMAIICILITAFTLLNSEVWVVQQMDSISGGTVIDMYGQSVESGKTEYYKDDFSSEKPPEELVQIDDGSQNIVQFFAKPLIAVAIILVLGVF